MEKYFEAVNDYVELVEGKVGELMDEYDRIGMTPEIVREHNKSFFDQLRRPKPTKDVIQSYFELVDYYVKTAEAVLETLMVYLQTMLAALPQQKMAFRAATLQEIVKLKQLKLGDPVVDTIHLMDQLLKSESSPYTIGFIEKYFSGDKINVGLHRYLVERWPSHLAQLTAYVDGKRLMFQYASIRPLFKRLKDVFDVETLPLDKQAQVKQADDRFEDYDRSNGVIQAQTIMADMSEYYSIVKKYNGDLKSVKEIVLYLQGGVSQAFLILRNTNDITPRTNPEEHKLLKRVQTDKTKTDNLVYLDKKGNQIEEQPNNFQEVFDRHTPRAQINDAILSRKNFMLLETGGTVVIIAYGQSGTGKTYTLTRLIESFAADMHDFELTGISTCQFYNDVMLEGGGKRLTAKHVADVPEDAAIRAQYKLGNLRQSDRCEDMYNSTKMYDIGAMIKHHPHAPIRLKIEPVVTPMPELRTEEMMSIQLHSRNYFKAASRLNTYATSDPKLNRLIETYRQLVFDSVEKVKKKTVQTAYEQFCSNEYYLPLYVQKDQLDFTDMNSALSKRVEECVSSKYGIESFKSGKFNLSENDLLSLIFMMLHFNLKRLTFDALTRQTDEIIQICAEGDQSVVGEGNQIVMLFNECMYERICTHALCDLVPVKLVSVHVYAVDGLFFNSTKLALRMASTVTKHPSKMQQHSPLQIEITEGRYTGYEAWLHEANRFQDSKYTILFSNSEKSILIQKDTGAPFTIGEVPKRVYGKTSYTTLSQYLLQKAVATSENQLLNDLYEGDTESAKRGFNMSQVKVREGVTSSNQWRFREGPPETLTFKVKTSTKVEPAQITYSDVAVKPNPRQMSIEIWKRENNLVLYDHFATLSQAHWDTNPAAYRAKFEHCIQISATGPDNVSNYSLFDHTELRYANYFDKYAKLIRSAYVRAGDNLTTITGDLTKIYEKINEFRFTRAMPQNPESSRSQLVTTLHLHKNGNQSKLILIDLAGNEKVDTTKKHIVTCESVYINSTLKFVTEMFLRMKEEYPGWKVNTEGKTVSYTSLTHPSMTQHTPPTQSQFNHSRPDATADPFQKYLYDISTPTAGLKPAIVMVVCAYEYYSSWNPPIPKPEVSIESLEKTFRFISALFHFGNPIATVGEVQHREIDQEMYLGGKRSTRKHKPKRSINYKRPRSKSKKKRIKTKHLTHDEHSFHLNHEEPSIF